MKLNIKYGIFTLLLILECASHPKFKNIQKIDPNYVNLYVLRSPNPTLGIYSFKILLEQMDGHFKNKKIKNILTFYLDNSEYCFFKLDEGYYNLKIGTENLSKILFMEKGNEYYFHFEILNRDYFSLPEYFIRSVTKEEAIRFLVDYNKLNKCSSSMD